LDVGTGDNVLIGGFIVTGTESKKVMLRAIGPSLPVSGALADPVLELHNSKGEIVAVNDNWKNSPSKQAIVASKIAPANPKESAIIAVLAPGAYTAIVHGHGGTGVALVEVYDLNQDAESKLANISTRGFVETDDNVMIGGVILMGTAPSKVLLRAIGPSLPVSGAMTDPTLELHDGDGTLIASNDNWKETQEAAIKATNVAPTNDAESAILVILKPNSYTAVVRGKNNTTGVALIEAYQID
jgi:hypothetical protein